MVVQVLVVTFHEIASKCTIRKSSQGNVSYGGVQRSDVLARVMHMRKESVGSEVFVRSIEAAPEPMCILASDQQLEDLKRFCTGDSSSVLCHSI